LPPFETIRETVARDAAQALARQQQERTLDKIVANYRVSLSPELKALR
jgi:hypothetical protein